MIPLLAIKPICSPTSSTLYPSEPDKLATYLNVSPIFPTSVFADVAVFANTSAKWSASLALSPKAVIASVTMSEVVPKSSPLAAAKFKTPLNADVDCSTFQPAIAMYSSACPDSSAVKTVLAPIFFAESVSLSSPALSVFAILATFDI